MSRNKRDRSAEKRPIKCPACREVTLEPVIVGARRYDKQCARFLVGMVTTEKERNDNGRQ